jgi:hypothetical protein
MACPAAWSMKPAASILMPGPTAGTLAGASAGFWLPHPLAWHDHGRPLLPVLAWATVGLANAARAGSSSRAACRHAASRDPG